MHFFIFASLSFSVSSATSSDTCSVSSAFKFVGFTNNKDPITNVTTAAKIQVVKGTTYDSVTGILSVTAATPHGLTNGAPIRFDNESLVFKCSQDNFTDEKKYPRPTDPANNSNTLNVTTFVGIANTFTVNVGIQTGGGTVSPASMELIMSVLETSTV